jgi:beta-lactamase regulating signal transducer with metallopeptidase domain
MSWLVIACLKNAILAVPLAAAALAIGGCSRRPALAHVLWVLVLVKLITPPLVDVPVGWRVDLAGWLAEGMGDGSSATVVAERPVPLTGQNLSASSSQDAAAPLAQGTPQATLWLQAGADRIRPMARAASTWLGALSWGVIFASAGAIWLLGSAATAGLLYARARRFQRFLNLACRDNERLSSRVRQLSYRTGLISYPKVVVVDGVVSPMLWGVGKGVRLLFPAQLVERLDPPEIDALLLHELAHFSRGDHWVRVLELVAYVVYWWNPVVWWACRQIEAAEEQCCDAWVVEHQSGTRRSYAEALLVTIEFLNEPVAVRPPAACGLGEVSLLKLRLRQIMRGELAAQLPRPALVFVLLAGLLLSPLHPAVFATASRESLAGKSAAEVAKVHAPAVDAPVAVAPADVASLITSQSPPAVVPTVAQPVSPALAPAISLLPSVLQPSRLYASVFSPNIRFKLEARTGRKTRLIHMQTGWGVDLGSHEVTCVSFAPDSRSFVTGHKDGMLRQWDSETGALLATIRGTAGPILSVAYAPDGTQFAAGTADGVVSVYSVAEQAEITRTVTPAGSVACVRWSPRGDRLAIALGDFRKQDESRLHIWAPAESVLLSDEPLTQPAGALEWLSDDALLVADWDGKAVVRNLRGSWPDQPYEVDKQDVSAANWSSDVRLVQRLVAEKLAAGAGL